MVDAIKAFEICDERLSTARATIDTLRGLLAGAIVYDVSPAAIDHDIRAKLIELGWTPPDD